MNALLIAALAVAQAGPQRAEPAGADVDSRKMARDRVVKALGEDALQVTRKHGDLAVEALSRCDAETGRGLVRVLSSPESKVCHPRALLESVRKNGTPCAAWIVRNQERLSNHWAVEAFTMQPMEYVHDLKDLDEQAAMLRANRGPGGAWLPEWVNESTAPWLVFGAGGALVAWAFYRKHRQGRGAAR